MVWVALPFWIVVTACFREINSGAGTALMDVQGKKTGLAVLWKAGEVGYYQNLS